jgi:hypothetical protein
MQEIKSHLGLLTLHRCWAFNFLLSPWAGGYLNIYNGKCSISLKVRKSGKTGILFL